MCYSGVRHTGGKRGDICSAKHHLESPAFLPRLAPETHPAAKKLISGEGLEQRIEILLSFVLSF